MIFNMVGGGGGSSTKSTIIVSIDTGSTVQAYSDSSYQALVKTASEKTTGEYWLTGLDNGTYYIKATKGTDTATASYTISEYGVYRIAMAYRSVPVFTYSGTYEVVHDDDTTISNVGNYIGDWKIRFLTSGTLNISALCGAADGIDIFAVGGGGGGGGGTSAAGSGGGGGYTTNAYNKTIAANTNYTITVGSGGTGGNGTNGTAGGESSFGNLANALGGNGGVSNSTGAKGGTGGSGGGSASSAASDNKGGSNGGNGGGGASGQGTTTYEFEDSNLALYAGGGAGSANFSTNGKGGAGGGGDYNVAGETNKGGGGGAYSSGQAKSGGSGIVIIRNARS